jgi:hypothetical protein
MKFKKEELEFLNLFSIYSENSINGDKTRIFIDGNKIYFCQLGINVKLIQVLYNKDNEENIEYIFKTSQLASLVKLCKEDSDIEIKGDYITFNKSAKYRIDDYDYEDTHPQEIIDNYSKDKLITITDLNKIRAIKSFIGKDKGYQTVAIMNNHFVTTNATVLAFIDTNNNIKEDQIPFKLLPLINYYQLDTLSVCNIDNHFSGVRIDNLYGVFEKVEHYLPPIFSPKIKEEYEHTNKLIVNTEEFKSGLHRLNVIFKEDINSKLYLTCIKGGILLQIREGHIGEEYIVAEVDKELEDFFEKTYCSALISIINLIKSDTFEIHITPDKENTVAMTIRDKDMNSTYALILAK